MSEVTRIALCFFGITRSLRFTHKSILRNVVNPLKAAGDLQIFGHYFDQRKIDNPRSKEFGEIPPNQHALLCHDRLILDTPSNVEVLELFNNVSPFGAGWKNDKSSLLNLCHQLVSLRHVTELALESNAEIFVFCRPDLVYHDSFTDIIDEAKKCMKPSIMSPYWQKHGGINDRFYIVIGRDAARKIGQRADKALTFCQMGERPLGAESFLAFAAQNLSVVDISHRATRVRFDGSYRTENFDCPRTDELVRYFKTFVRQPGLFEIIRHVIRLRQAVVCGRRYSDIKNDLVF